MSGESLPDMDRYRPQGVPSAFDRYNRHRILWRYRREFPERCLPVTVTDRGAGWFDAEYAGDRLPGWYEDENVVSALARSSALGQVRFIPQDAALENRGGGERVICPFWGAPVPGSWTPDPGSVDAATVPAEERRRVCDGPGPGHGRTGGVASLPVDEFSDGGFFPVQLGGGGAVSPGAGGEFEVHFGVGRGRRMTRIAWNCDWLHAFAFLLLAGTEPVYYHPESGLLAAGAPPVRRFLSVRWNGPAPCMGTTVS